MDDEVNMVADGQSENEGREYSKWKDCYPKNIDVDIINFNTKKGRWELRQGDLGFAMSPSGFWICRPIRSNFRPYK